MSPETDFSVRPFLGGYDKNFTYLITCSHTRSSVLVDAAIPIDQIMPSISNPPLALLITHTHPDHIRYLNDYINIFPDMIVFGHSESALMYKIKNFRITKHQQKFEIGHLPFTSIYTPGHYFDSICYLLKPTLFTGDTLFVGRTGRVISQRSDIKELYNSVYNRLLILSKDLRLYPGHDYGKQPSIKIKHNIKISPLLRAKNLKDFIKEMEQYELNRTLDKL